jgi:hypothetical protein
MFERLKELLCVQEGVENPPELLTLFKKKKEFIWDILFDYTVQLEALHLKGKYNERKDMMIFKPETSNYFCQMISNQTPTKLRFYFRCTHFGYIMAAIFLICRKSKKTSQQGLTSLC